MTRLRRTIYLLIACVLVAVIANNVYGRWRKAAQHRLVEAAANGDSATVRSLLRWGISPNEIQADSGPYSGPAVVAAASGGHTETLKVLLDHGGNANARDNVGTPSLYWAVQFKHHDTVLLLLQRGASPIYPNTSKLTASILNDAIAKRWMDVFKLALDRGADPNGVPTDQISPLCVAVAMGNVEAARLLLDKGAAIDAQGFDWMDQERRRHKMTALMVAAQIGNLPLVNLLLRKGASLRAVDQSGDMPLTWAAESGNVAVARRLLPKGIDINTGAGQNGPPLLWAALSGNPVMVHWLLQQGADPNAADRNGQTALMNAVLLRRSLSPAPVPVSCGEAMVRDLLAHGADVNAANRSGQTVLMQAVHGSVSIVTRLLEHGARVNAADKQGHTPLMAAAHFHRADMLRTLLQRGADIRARDRQGKTALMLTLDNVSGPPNLAATEALLDAGAEVNTSDAEGRTVLTYALYSGAPDIVQALVAHGADVNAHGGQPDSPLRIAMRGRQTRIAAILRKAGAKD